MHEKGKTEVERLDGIRLYGTYDAVTKNLSKERRNHEILKRRMIKYKSLRNGNFPILILLLGK